MSGRGGAGTWFSKYLEDIATADSHFQNHRDRTLYLGVTWYRDAIGMDEVTKRPEMEPEKASKFKIPMEELEHPRDSEKMTLRM